MPADPLLESLRAFVRQHALLREGQRVAVAVSGGVDSVALLHLLREDFAPTVVHVDHGLRADSRADAAFVAALAGAWGLPVTVERIIVPEGSSRQGRARAERYRALERVALSQGLEAVAVAHQRDDVAETLLLQLLRGAGPRGWRALPVARPIARGSTVRLVRPLRFAGRAEIEAYARAQGLEWREDPSNEALEYRRVAVRRRIFPLLKRYFGDGVLERLAAAAELAEAYVEAGAALAPAAALREARVEVDALSVEALGAMSAVVRRGVILEVLARLYPEAPRSAASVAEIERLLKAQPGRRVALGEVVVWREREVLRFATPPRPVTFVGTVSVPGQLETPWGALRVELVDEPPDAFPAGSDTEVVDADRLGSTLTLRTWRPGDRFVPFGMQGQKKVSDLLTERRVRSAERGRQLVLLSEGAIVWVVGHRLAEGLRVRPETRRLVRLAWLPRSSA